MMTISECLPGNRGWVRRRSAGRQRGLTGDGCSVCGGGELLRCRVNVGEVPLLDRDRPLAEHSDVGVAELLGHSVEHLPVSDFTRAVCMERCRGRSIRR